MSINKKRIFPFFAGILLAANIGYAAPSNAGKRICALDSTLWTGSEWISVVNAPVVTGSVSGTNERAADGASWFVASIKNNKKVKSAKWMTTGLGVYRLFVSLQ